MNVPAPLPSLVLAEIAGRDGAFVVTERLVQKLWLRREFREDGAAVIDGRPVRVTEAGAWNRLPGPDFLGARVVLGGEAMRGDVEIHLRQEGWREHGHDRDPAYDNVVLHVVLFPPEPGFPAARTASGRELPTLVLLPLLLRGLEESAVDEALDEMTGGDVLALVESWAGGGPGAAKARLATAAERRWRGKCAGAALRVRRLGWEGACHAGALEVLGFPSNRVPMLLVAEAFPLTSWREAPPTHGQWKAIAGSRWRVSGVRPANQPATRLGQYAAWVAAVPDWPERWRSWCGSAAEFPSVEDGTEDRREAGFTAFRDALAADILGGAIPGRRFHNLVTDLLLPLAGSPAWSTWAGWWPGDAPSDVRLALRAAGVSGPGRLVTNGDVQGVLGEWLASLAAPGVLRGDGDRDGVVAPRA